MPFKTNNFTVMEYYNMDLIICVEYENTTNSSEKLLKIVINREYDYEMINIFNLSNIPKEASDIYEYSKAVSKIVKEDDVYAIYGQRIHRNDTTYKQILTHNTNPLEKHDVEINNQIWEAADINHLNDDTREYYNRVLKTIKWKSEQ